MIDSLIENLELGGYVDLVCKHKEKNIIIQSENKFFTNKDHSPIEEGEYRILGKILKINKENETISLMRSSILKNMGKSFLNQFLEIFKSQKLEDAGYEMPEFEIEFGNGILIIPIAIYN